MGWYWSATRGRLLVYESLLELSRLLLADFDPTVVGIAAQPFRFTLEHAAVQQAHDRLADQLGEAQQRIGELTAPTPPRAD